MKNKYFLILSFLLCTIPCFSSARSDRAFDMGFQTGIAIGIIIAAYLLIKWLRKQRNNRGF